MKGGILKNIVIIQGLAILLLGGAVFYIYRDTPSPESSPETNNEPIPTAIEKPQTESSKTDLTKNWKVYEDDYGFSFLYPPDFKFNFEYPGQFGENFPNEVITAIPPYESTTELTFTVISGTLVRNKNDELGGMCTSEETTLGKTKIPVIARMCSGSVIHSTAYKIQLKNSHILTIEVSGGTNPAKEIPEAVINALLDSLKIAK